MRIRFKTAMADERGSFMEGRVVEVSSLPARWQPWLEHGVIEILPDVVPETAEFSTGDRAVLPRGRGRGGRSARVA